MKRQIQIGNKVIGDGQPIFIIAEVGNQHCYDLKNVKQQINEVSDSGADAIKFMFWYLDEILIRDDNPKMYDMIKEWTFTHEEWAIIKHWCDEKNLIMFATVNSPSGFDLAEALDLPAYKISTWDWNYKPLWEWIAKTGKPIIADIGAVTEDEIKRNIKWVEDTGNRNLVLLHDYHTINAGEINMRTIPYIREELGVLSGYSSPGDDFHTDLLAVALGAKVIEKKFSTLLGRLIEFNCYVRVIRGCEVMLGKYGILPSQADLRQRTFYFRRLVADANIPKGETILYDDLESKRGETGISPEYIDSIVGHVATRDIKPNETIKWEDVE